jgi:hypothetical protein
MKKWKKYLGIWLLIGLVGLGLGRMGFINILGKPSQEQEQTRQTFISEFNKLVGKKIEFTDNTMVVYVKKKLTLLLKVMTLPRSIIQKQLMDKVAQI